MMGAVGQILGVVCQMCVNSGSDVGSCGPDVGSCVSDIGSCVSDVGSCGSDVGSCGSNLIHLAVKCW
jgi:hypothetical protein